MNKKELVELVKSLLDGRLPEEEASEVLRRIEKCVPDPYISDLMFHSDPQLTPEEIVEKAFEYKPIRL